MRKYNRPLEENESCFSKVITYLQNKIEYRILNGIPSCRLNKEKIENYICDIKIREELIKKERLSLENYKRTYLETYPMVDPTNPYVFVHGMLTRLSTTTATLSKSAIFLTPKYRQMYGDVEKKKEIWNESVLFAKEYQLSMFTDEYPEFVKEFVSTVVDLITLIKGIMEFCESEIQEEKSISEDYDESKRLYEEELEDCISSLNLLSINDSDKEDVMGKILSEHKEKGYGIGYHNPQITKSEMMLHAARVMKHRAISAGLAPTSQELILFKGDMEKVVSVRHILNNIDKAKEAHNTISNLIAVLYLEYADQANGTKKHFVQYANAFLSESDKIKPGSIYRPTREMNNRLRHEIKSAFDEILKTKPQEKVS